MNEPQHLADDGNTSAKNDLGNNSLLVLAETIEVIRIKGAKLTGQSFLSFDYNQNKFSYTEDRKRFLGKYYRAVNKSDLIFSTYFLYIKYIVL